METYEWQKNKAVVDRLYYSERILVNSFLAASGMTAVEGLYIYKNYLPNRARARIPQYWMAFGALNTVTLFVLLRPLTKEEISVQWRKRKIMGKWLYSLFHLETEGDNTQA